MQQLKILPLSAHLHMLPVAMHAYKNSQNVQAPRKKVQFVCMWRGDEDNSDSSNKGGMWTGLWSLEVFVLC